MKRSEWLLHFPWITAVDGDVPCEGHSIVNARTFRPCKHRARFHYAGLDGDKGRSGNYCHWHVTGDGVGDNYREERRLLRFMDSHPELFPPRPQP